MVAVSVGNIDVIIHSSSISGIIKSLARVKEDMRLTRYFTYMFVSIWKIIAFFMSTLIILYCKGNSVGHLFTMFGSAFGEHIITVTEVQSSIGGGTIPDLSEILPNGETETITADGNTPIYVLLIQIFGAYFTYIFGEYLSV